MAQRVSFFATCAPGVEPVLQGEARALSFARVERQKGGVYFEGRPEDAWRANLWLRTAVRVLLRVARFPCRDERELYDAVREIDWSRFLAPDGVLVVDAHSNESALDHTRFVEQRVKDAIVDQFRERTGRRPSVDRETAQLGVYAHLFRDRCTLSLDTSGRALHRRGWRRDQGRAPLAETLAAAVVQLSGWDGRAPLLDPFCGSGTLLVEAALLADGIAPGLFRERFGFEHWPGHDAAGWRAAREEARAAARKPSRKRTIRGSDVDPERIEGARANLDAAGLLDAVQLEVADARDFRPRPGWNAWVASNLPYGRRVGGGKRAKKTSAKGRSADATSSSSARDLDRLYRDFGGVLRERCAGYTVALLCAADRRIQELGLTGAQETALVNGGLDCRLLRTRIAGD